jgi:hypothetical protein
MAAGVELDRGILQGFNDSCAAVFFVTPRFKDENYLATEVNYAMIEKRKKGARKEPQTRPPRALRRPSPRPSRVNCRGQTKEDVPLPLRSHNRREYSTPFDREVRRQAVAAWQQGARCPASTMRLDGLPLPRTALNPSLPLTEQPTSSQRR